MAAAAETTMNNKARMKVGRRTRTSRRTRNYHAHKHDGTLHFSFTDGVPTKASSGIFLRLFRFRCGLTIYQALSECYQYADNQLDPSVSVS